MILPLVLIFVGFMIALSAWSAAKSSKRPSDKVLDPKDPIHPDVKFGALVIACTGGLMSLIGFIFLVIRICTR